MWCTLRSRCLLLSGLVLFAAAPLGAAPDFDPRKHFPRESYFFFSGDAGKLRSAFRATPLGELFLNPRALRALGKLPDVFTRFLDEQMDLAEFEEEFGIPFFDFLDMFQGEVAMTWPAIDAQSGPAILFAFEVGQREKGILGFFHRLATEVGNNQEPLQEKYKGHDVYRWQVRWGPPVLHGVVGGYVLLAINNADLEGAIDRYRGAPGLDGLESNAEITKARLRAVVGGAEPLFTLFFDVKRFREKLYEAIAEHPRDAAEARAVFKATGLETLGTVFYQLGVRDGDWDGKLLLDAPGGTSGAIRLLSELLGAPADLSGLEKVPAAAGSVSCGSIHAGRFVRQLVELSRETVPEFAPEVDAFIANFEKVTGVSVRRDLYDLGRLDLFSFQVAPPAGGLIPDSITLCSVREAQPYLALLDKLARGLGGKARNVEVLGHDVTYLRIGGLGRALGLVPPAGAPGPRMPPWIAMFADPAVALSFATLEDGWLVVGSTPQAVGRYLEYYAKAEPFTGPEDLRELVHGRIGKQAAFAIVRDGGGTLAVYNTLVSWFRQIAPSIEEQLGPLGIDAGLLPAGEVFRDRFEEGFLLVRAGEDSMLLHHQRFLSNNAIAAVVPAMGFAGLFWFSARGVRVERQLAVPADVVLEGFGEASAPATPAAEAPAPPRTWGGRRLARVGKVLQDYVEKTGSRAFPHDPRGGVHPFQVLAESGVLTDPSVLVHPFSTDRPAVRGEDGKITIGESNSSYHIVPWKQGPRDHKSRVLAYEKAPFHRAGRHVLFVDGSVQLLREAEFRRLLEEQTTRYGK